MQDRHSSDNLTSKVLPQFFPAHWLEKSADIVWSDFPSRIRIGYVVRGPENYSFVMQHELASAGISVQDLHAVALRNLRAMPMPELKIGKTPGGPELYLGDTQDNFNAARILLPDVQRVFTAELGTEFYAAIPCRDWFICWSCAQSDEWKAKNAASARQTFLDDDYNLTPDVLLVSNGSFSIHLEQRIDA